MILRHQGNIHTLEQGVRLLQTIDDKTYRCEPDNMDVGSIGAQIRHILDHYACLLHGIEGGTIDYSARERQKEVEVDRMLGIKAMKQTCRALSGFDKHQIRCLRIRPDACRDSHVLRSSLDRELEFLVSHTVHHFAIIGLLCSLQDVRVEPGFGVAPSTLRFRDRSINATVKANADRISTG